MACRRGHTIGHMLRACAAPRLLCAVWGLGFHATRALRARKHLSAAEALELGVGEAEERLDVSLFEDPMAGLSFSEAAELTEKEMSQSITDSVRNYDSVKYTVMFAPVVDLVGILADNNLLPHIKPEVAVSSWFSEPRSCFSSSSLRDSMGSERWEVFSARLHEWNAEVEALSPLHRVLRFYDVDGALAVPYFRVLGANLWSKSWDEKQARALQLPSVALSLAGGKAEKLIGVSKGEQNISRSPSRAEQERRIAFFAEMFVALGQETGNAGPAFLGIQLLRANSLEVPYRVQKALTNVFSAIQRIKTDWDLRSGGQLRSVLHKWTSVYLKKVRRDAAGANMADLLAPSAEVVAKIDVPSHDISSYFKRQANDEVAAMRRNIAERLSSQQSRMQRESERDAAAKAEAALRAKDSVGKRGRKKKATDGAA